MKSKTPLVDAIEKYGQANVYPLHTPGHKGGRGAADSLHRLLGEKALTCDVSLMEELDDIHEPSGCIKEAQDLAAQIYGADATFFALNGTTGAIHAMLLGSLQPGDKILIPRNAHRSVYGGLVLAGLIPVYVQPAYDSSWNLLLQITPEQVEEAFRLNPEIKAVFLTSPNYYGLAADVAAIGEIAHGHGAVLLVDEAHGPHLGFCRQLPPGALQCGADAVAQSTHKILGALTQCSMLHVQGQRLNQAQMAGAMSLVTTTSPNNLLLASLDAARAQLAEDGEGMCCRALNAANIMKGKLHKITGLQVLERELIGVGGVVAMDETKVTINVTGLGLTGVEAGEILRREGIAVELVDATNVLFLVTYGDMHPQWNQVVENICRALTKARSIGKELPPVEVWQGEPQCRYSPRQAFFAPKEILPWTQALGKICGEQVSFYPPGIPLLLPGELITRELQDYCNKMLAMGLHLSGPRDGTLATIQVIK